MNVFVNKNCRHVYFEDGEFEAPDISLKLLELADGARETVRLHLERAADLDLTALCALGVFARELARRGVDVDLCADSGVCALLAGVGLDGLFTRLQAAS